MKNFSTRFVAILFIALVLGISLRAGDWFGERFVEDTARQQIKNEAVNRAQVEVLYESWKRAHKGSVEQLMKHYAPNARIVREAGNVENLQQLQALAVLVRQEKTFDDVRDLDVPDIKSEGDKMIVQARQRYAHSSGKYQPSAGNRKLIWQEMDGQWMIVEDNFPKSYTPTK